MIRFVRPEAVAHLADAYRNKGRSPYADAVIANRHVDYFPDECIAAVNTVLAELAAELVIADAERTIMGDYPSAYVARLSMLSELANEEFSELRRAGFLDDLEP